MANVRIGHGLQQMPRRRSLQRQGRNALGHVVDGDLETDGILREPAQARIGRGPPVAVLTRPRHGSIIDHLSAFITPRRVVHLPDGQLAGVAGDDAVHQLRRVRSAHDVLEQRRHVDERRGVTDGVVFVLVVCLVRADGVIAGPLAVIQALGERKCTGVNGGANRHAVFQTG